jgi:hypothetical protein
MSEIPDETLQATQVRVGMPSHPYPSRDADINTVAFDNKKVLNLSKAQLKALGLQYKPPQTEAQQKRNERLSQMSKARHEQQRKDKEEYERAQMAALQNKLIIDTKMKQKYNKKSMAIELDASSDDEMMSEYQEFLKFKNTKSKATTKKPKEAKKTEINDESSDDEVIQKKAAKATKIIETVNKLDSAINKMSVGNPYLDLFNKTKK